MPISATTPVVAPAEASVTYNQWFLTQLIVKADEDSAPAIVHLRRSATVDGKTVLMPNGPTAEISFTVDIFKQLANFPAFGTALEAVLSAVVAFASSKKLL